jgi:MoaA/NifB/PqqE/SkfB family radical SAM enzyme
MATNPGWLFPGVPALVRIAADGRLRLVDVRSGWEADIGGAPAADLEALLAGGTISDRLRALAGAHPAIATALGWAAQPHQPLTPAASLRQDGFGILFVELLGRCNERCLHCYAEASPEVDAAIDRATCEAIVDDAAALDVSRIQFTGGDPLLCAWLPDLVARAAGLGIPTIEIYTNGLLLSDALLDRLAPAGPRFAFSFYSHDAATHDAITRTPGSQRRTARAIERAAARGLRVRAAMVVMAENADHVEPTMRFLRDLGVDQVAASGSFAVGRGDRFEARIDAGTAGNAHGGVGEPQRHGKLAVTYTGDVVPCIFSRDLVLGNVTRRRLRDIAGDPQVRRRLGMAERPARDRLQCAGCRLTAEALG